MAAKRDEFIADLAEKIRAALAPHASDEPLALLDFPDHANVGDSAIWLGEIAFFKRKWRRIPDYACNYRNFARASLDKFAPSGPVFIHGGGNFGDIWPHHHQFREHVIETLRHRKIIQLPQSIHFGSEQARDRTARLISAHPDFTLLVRDVESLDLARRHFDCPSLLVPDMAFCLGAMDASHASRDAMALLRTDSETRGMDTSSAPDLPVEDWLDEDLWKVRTAKLIGLIGAYIKFQPASAQERLLTAAAAQRVARGIRQISTARMIITDRLHCCIISLLLGRPVAILDNNYGKLGRFKSAWGIDNSLAYSARSFDDAAAWAREAVIPMAAQC